ncbi:MAG: FeoB-associated Cys-rich membrane protein [Clostridia bacterium]|nr:FeoB-associated Cys-rich membrane protein [Clostridia bacterium]
MDYILNNIGNIAAVLILAIITVMVLLFIIKRRKGGKTACGCDCAFCGKDCENKEQ